MPMPYIIRPKGYSFSRDTDSFQSESWRNPFSSQPVPEREFQKLSDSAPRLNADSMRAVFSGKDPYAFVPKEDRRVVDELARRKASDTGRPLEEIQKEFGVYAQLSNVGPLRGLSFSQCGELAEETCRRLLEQDGEDVSDPVPGYNGGMANRKANYTLKYFEHLKSLYAAEEPSGIQRVGNAVAAGAQKLATAVYKPVAGAVALGTKAASAIGAISDDTAKGILDGMAREVSGNDQWIAEGREGYVSDPEWYKHWDGFAKNLALTVISEAPTQAYRTALAIFTGPMGSALEAGAEASSGKFADLHAEGKDAEMGAGKTAINLLSTGMINGGLQWMAGEWAVGRMFGPGKAAVRSSFKEAAKHVVKGFPVEAGQEGAEQLLENFTDICTGVHGDPALLTSEERLAILMQGVPESALVGGALGGVTGSITAGRVYKAQKLVNEAIPYAQNVKEALTRAGSLSEDERAVLDHANRILDGVKTCDMGVELARLEERKRNIVAQFAWEMKRADDYAFSDPEGSYGQDADPVEVGTRQWLDSLAKRSDLTDRGVRARMDMEARMACAELLAKIPHDPEETGKAAFAFAKKAGVPEGFRVDVAQGEVTWATIPAEVRAFVTENGGGQTVPRWAPIDNGVWINANLVTPSQVPNVMLSRSLMERGLHEVLGSQYEDTMLKAYSALKDDPEMRRIADGMREDSAMPGAGMTDADMIDAATRWMIDAASDGRRAPGAFRKALQAFRQAIGRSPFGGATLSDQDVLTLAGRALDKARSGDGEASVREFVDGFDERELSEIDRMAQAAGVKWRRATAEEYSAAVEEAAGRQGISAEQFQKERGVNGWFQEEDGTVVLSPGADHLSAFLHEMLHWLASSRPEQYRTIAAAVMEEAGREAPEGSFATDEMQEAVADEFSRQMRDNAAAKRMLSRLDSDRNAAFAIRDFLSEAAHRLSGDAFADVRGNLERLVRWLGNASTRAGGAQGVRFSTKNPDYANRSEGQKRLRRLESFYSREQIDAIAAMLKPIVEEIAAPEFFEGTGSAKGEEARAASLVQGALAQQGVKVESASLAIDLARHAYFARQEDLCQVAIRRISAWLESDSSEEPIWLADEMKRALRPIYFAERNAERRSQSIRGFVAAAWGDGAMPVLKDAVQTAEAALQTARQAQRILRADPYEEAWGRFQEQAKVTEARLKKDLDALRKEYDAFKKETGEASQAKLDELQKELDKKTRAYERLKEADAKRTQNNHNDLMELRRLLRDQKRDHMTEQEIRKVGSLAAKVTRNMPEHQAKQFVQNAMRLAMTPNTQDAAHPHGARTEGFDLLMEKAREELQRQAAQQAVEQMRALANRNRTASTRKGILTSRITPEAQAKIDFAADCLELGARASRAAIDRGVELMQRLESEENPEESVQFMGRKVGREELSWMLHALETYGETPEEHAAEGWQELNSLVENGRAEFDAARAERTARVSAAANEVKERIQGTRDVDRSAANREDKPTGFFNKIGVSTLKNDLLRLNRDEELETDFGKGGWLNKAWRSINEAEYDLSARNLKLREDTHEFLKRLAGGTRTGYARFVADAGKEQDTGVEIPVYSSRIGGKEDPNAYYVKGRRPSAKILVDVDAARAALVEFEAKGSAEVRTDEGTVQMDEFNAAFLRRQLADHDAKLELDLELSPDAAENELLNRELNEDREKGKLTMRIPLREEETENIHLECSKLQALQILLSWDQSDVRTIMEWNGWKESHMERLRAFCGEKVLEFGQWMRSRLAESRQELDAEVVKRFGAHMPTVENYFPTRYRRQAQAGLTPARQAGQAKTPDTGFLVSRRFHTLNLDTTRDAFTVFMDTMQGQNRFIAMANRMADIKNVLMRPDVKEAIRTRHGSEFLAGLTKKLAAVDGGGLVVETNGILSRLCSPFVLDALGFNPSSFMKQMLSGFGFLNWGGVTTGGFVRAFGDVLSMSPEYRRFLKEAKASDYYQNRVKTGGHAAQRFVSGDSKQAILAHGFADAVSKASMKPIQWGDSASALGPGGFAVYQDTRLRVLDECIEQELSAAREEAQSEGRTLSRAEELSARERGEEAARKEALMQWQMATDQTQQSSYAKDKSLGVQSAYGRFFGLFMQNPMQILDLYAQNLRTMKRTGDKGQAARNLIVNHVLLPTLMLAVTDFFRYGFDPDKWEKVNLKAKFAEYLAAWIVGPFAGAIILGDVYSGTISSLTAKLFGTSAKGNPSGTFVQRVADEWTRLWSLISGDAPFEDKAAGLASAGALAASLVPIFSSNPAVTSISEAAAKVLSTGSSAQRQSKRLRKMVGMDGEDEQKDRARKIMQSR